MTPPLPPILHDVREKHPYCFSGLRTPAPAVHSARLTTGDYSLEGLSALVAVERKTLEDLFHTVAHRRRAFQVALGRLSRLAAGAVVVEATWSDISRRPPPGAALPPAAVRLFVSQWRSKHPSVRWYFCAGRREAEELTLALLERYHRALTLTHTETA